MKLQLVEFKINSPERFAIRRRKWFRYSYYNFLVNIWSNIGYAEDYFFECLANKEKAYLKFNELKSPPKHKEAMSVEVLESIDI